MIPRFHIIQEIIKRITKRFDTRLSEDNILSAIEQKIDFFNQANIPSHPKVVVEQGTGWHGADLLLFYLCGAELIITYDTLPWLKEDLFKNVLSVILSHLNIIRKWEGINIHVLNKRANNLKMLKDLHLSKSKQEALRTEFLRAFRQYVWEGYCINLEIAFVDKIERPETGKHRYIISNVPPKR